MKINKLLCLIGLGIFALSVPAQKTMDKPYHKWSKDEAFKMISNLPFADQYQSTDAVNAVSTQANAADQADNRFEGRERGRGSGRYLAPTPVVVRLHSALPVRQAIVRLQEISAGYDKMNEADQKKFDASVAGFLECAVCKGYYVVTMFKFKNSAMGVVDDGLFQTSKLEEFQNRVWLENDKGEKRMIEQFSPAKGPGDTAILFFKRQDEKGNVLITPDTKEFRIVFNNEFRSSKTNQYAFLMPSAFEFKVSKIMIGDQVAF
jgi:hypothetical protein